MIIEPVMMNIGVVPPPPGYLDGARRPAAHPRRAAHVRRGQDRAVDRPGGATELFGVVPDIVCLAKALGGGVPCGAVGGTVEVMQVIADGTYEQVGTFNGNPLTMAAAKALLLDVLTPAAYRHLDDLRGDFVERIDHTLRSHHIPGYVNAYGAKGAVVFSPAASATTATSAATTPGTAMPTGCTSTTAACSCRRGGRWSSGRSRSSTTPVTSTGAAANLERFAHDLHALMSRARRARTRDRRRRRCRRA